MQAETKKIWKVIQNVSTSEYLLRCVSSKSYNEPKKLHEGWSPSNQRILGAIGRGRYRGKVPRELELKKPK